MTLKYSFDEKFLFNEFQFVMPFEQTSEPGQRRML